MGAYNLNLLMCSTLFSMLFAGVFASCDCKNIASWDDFRSLIIEANENETESSQKLLLCPFHIQKVIQKDTDHWEVFAPIKKPMHIACQKQSSSDQCWFEITGDKCNYNENCGRQMIKIRSSEYKFVSIPKLMMKKSNLFRNITIAKLKCCR